MYYSKMLWERREGLKRGRDPGWSGEDRNGADPCGLARSVKEV